MTSMRARAREVRAALGRVTDPELDESVVGRGFRRRWQRPICRPHASVSP
jgi:hypothetical protein